MRGADALDLEGFRDALETGLLLELLHDLGGAGVHRGEHAAVV